MKVEAACELPQTRRKYTPKFVPLILALTFVFTILPLYFPFSHNKSSLTSSFNIGSYQHLTPPKPNNPPPRHDKVRSWRRGHGYGGGGVAVAVAQELSTNPPPNLDTPANKTEVRKPDENEIKSPGSAQTDLIIAGGIHSNSEGISSKRQPARDSDVEVKMIRSNTTEGSKKCDLFTGEWVPNAEGPYYTNTSCNAIQEHQNCMKFGRPDTGFLKWRWKPDECELPIFDPYKFLELVRGKSLAFVGDSVARNHMQSLICLLSRVVHPVDVSKPTDENRLYQYTDYNFSVSIISSPYLIRTQKPDPNDFTRPFNLFLDEFDETWTSKIPSFDYIIISAGHCARWAFQTAFRAINAAGNFNGVTFLRTFAPSHLKGGPWDKGGDCVRTRPFKRNETVLEDYSQEMYSVQLEELRTAQEAGRRTGRKFRLFDATKPMMLRADGHPSKYGHWPVANRTIPNDCVHWCLPGPIDAWNDFLQELLKREVGRKSKSFT
ncbi:UNVERIFIED_CONTAM: protein trichome birefringence-like 19 [Sesamum radiatum]|uniref:Protein trichome birefringence-like 19 n=1 Tax=Sesamum radiatum TaxID=300843 RepID=A0AAW2RCH7_SESRA